MGATKILAICLALLVGCNIGLCNNGCQRSEWSKQRAVILAETLSLNDQQWMDGTEKNIGDACTGSGSSDDCTKATIAVHYYYEKFDKHGAGEDKTFLVISDLTRSLKCVSGICDCAENTTKAVDKDGTKLCIAEDSMAKGEECIHHDECKKDMGCIYDATGENKDCGEIEDMRRFCGSSGTVLPAMILLILPAIIVFN